MLVSNCVYVKCVDQLHPAIYVAPSNGATYEQSITKLQVHGGAIEIGKGEGGEGREKRGKTTFGSSIGFDFNGSRDPVWRHRLSVFSSPKTKTGPCANVFPRYDRERERVRETRGEGDASSFLCHFHVWRDSDETRCVKCVQNDDRYIALAGISRLRFAARTAMSDLDCNPVR